jgi:hypothetical protein
MRLLERWIFGWSEGENILVSGGAESMARQPTVGSRNVRKKLPEKAAFSQVALLEVCGQDPTAYQRFDGEALPEVLLAKESRSRVAPLFWRRPPDRKHAYGAGPLPDRR